jgi:lysozyme
MESFLSQLVVDLSSDNPDVSSFQQAKAAGVVGLMHRATLGLNQVDPMFVIRMKAARAAGLICGATHLFFPSDDPRLQARQFAAEILPFAPLPIATDFEWVKKNGKQDWDGVVNGTKLAQAFFDALTTVFKGSFLDYDGKAFADQYLQGWTAETSLWVPDYNVSPPRLPSGRSSYVLWQTGQQLIPGIQGPVDVNTTADNISFSDLVCSVIVA